jgi:ubiquinone/menaquinone biosynthesis C-methylase UbiE
MTDHAQYLPGMGKSWLLPLYDPLTRLLGLPAVHRELVAHARLAPGQRVLDIGCGTGNLVRAVKSLHRDVEVTGIDPDPAALARGRRKAARARLDLRFDPGFAQALPYPDASFDRVLSSLMFHHLDEGDRPRALSEARRVLKPGGAMVVLDFAGSHRGPMSRSHRLRDHAGGRIPELMLQAGFAEAGESGHTRTRVGRCTLWTGRV